MGEEGRARGGTEKKDERRSNETGQPLEQLDALKARLEGEKVARRTRSVEERHREEGRARGGTEKEGQPGGEDKDNGEKKDRTAVGAARRAQSTAGRRRQGQRGGKEGQPGGKDKDDGEE